MKFLLLLPLAVSTMVEWATGGTSNAVCPSWSNALYHDGKCYKFFVGTKKNWQDAGTECYQQGGVLAEPTTDAAMAYLRNQAQQKNLDDGVWLGATRTHWRTDTVTSFSWESTGEAMSSGLDSHIGNGGWFDNRDNAEDCLELRYDSCYLNDMKCMETGYYVCEKVADVLEHEYLAVLPTRDGDVIDPFLFITTNYFDTVYVNVKEYKDGSLVNTVEAASLTWTVPYSADLRTDIRISATTDVYSNYVKIESTETVTVVLFCVSQTYTLSTVVLPVAVLKELYVIINLPRTDADTNYISITGLDTGLTEVIMTFSCRNVTFTVDGMEYREPVEATINLAQYETAVYQSEADLTGSLVSANGKIAVFVGQSSTTGRTLMQAVPLTVASSTVVTVSAIKTTIQTVQEDAVLLNVASNAWYRDRGGYVWDLELTSPFTVIGASQPFLSVISSIGFSHGTGLPCLMPAVPEVMWKNVYNLCISPRAFPSHAIQLYVVIETSFANKLRINYEPISSSLPCLTNSIYSDSHVLRVCTITANSGCSVLDSDDSNQPFVAYLGAVDSTNVICYPVEFDLTVSNPEYDALNMSHLTSPFYCSPNNVDIASTTTATTPTTTTTTTTTTTVTTTRPNEDQLTADIRQQLVVDVKSTSQYRRKKISILDRRVSSTAMGIVGIFVCLSVSSAIFIIDISSLCKCSKRNSKD